MDRDLETAAFLFEMREEKRRFPRLPEHLTPRDLAEGYRAQDLLIEKLLQRLGGRPIGYKIAATNVLAQKDMDVDAPFFGRLLSATSHRTPAVLPASPFTLRLIEPEFAFEIGNDVPQNAQLYTAQSVRPFIGTAFASIEVVNHRFHDWKVVGAPSIAADNAIHGAWIEGIPYAGWQSIDFAQHPVTLVVNGVPTYHGSGANVLGNPLNVVAWLANELNKMGRQLRRGDRITTGTTTAVYPAMPWDRCVADFGVLGRVEVAFEE
jgi:2-keto-4-pentenoate hydratase